MDRVPRRGLIAGFAGTATAAVLDGCDAKSGAGGTASHPTRSHSAAATSSGMPGQTVSRRLRASGLQDVVDLGAPGVIARAVDNTVVVGTRPAAVVQKVASLADGFAGQAASLVGVSETSSVLLLVPAAHEQYVDWTGGGSLPNLSERVGVTVWPSRPLLSWVVLNPAVDDQSHVSKRAKLKHGQLMHVIAHEVFHAVTLPVGGGSGPLWLTEGAAEWAGTVISRVAYPKPTARPYLPTDAQLRSASLKRMDDAYYFAATFVAYLMQRDQEAATMLYNKGARAPARGIDGLVRKYFGVSLDHLTKAWLAQYETETAPESD